MSDTRAAFTMKPTDRKVTDSAGRVLIVTELGPSAMLNVLEMAGGNGENNGWTRMALLMCSVVAIDDRPLPFPRSKLRLLANADEIGNDGLIAISAALMPEVDADESAADVAKQAAEAELAASRSSERPAVP